MRAVLQISKALLMVGAVLLGGCEVKPTESEFNALKQAEKSFEEWAHGLVGSESPAKLTYDEILDGPIIRSQLGKNIRSNMQDAMALIIMAYLNTKEAQRLSAAAIDAVTGDADAKFGTDKLINSIAKQKIKEIEKLKSTNDSLIKTLRTLEKGRRELFQQMRRDLEEL